MIKMNQGHRVPKTDFEVIERFDSCEDNDLAVKMVEFYQEQRDRNVSLEDAYLKTLQDYSTPQQSLRLVNHRMDGQVTSQYVF